MLLHYSTMMRLLCSSLVFLLCSSLVFLPAWSVNTLPVSDHEQGTAVIVQDSCEADPCCSDSEPEPSEDAHQDHGSNDCPGKSCHDTGACSHGCGPSETAPSSHAHIKLNDDLGHSFAQGSDAALIDSSAVLSPQQFEGVDSPPPRS